MTESTATLPGRDVSRETAEKLRRFEALIRKWNPVINLVSRTTIEDLRTRHFLDSTQIFDLAPAGAKHWVDLGSGGGFPGLIVAILAADERPDLSVTLIESDQRKAAFLTTAARELGISPRVITERIETVAPIGADVLSARALAPLDTLLSFAERHLAPGGTAIFPKGANHQAELEQALEHWRFSYQKVPSKTDAAGVILIIGGISRV
ncbi:16S rRNA (guanine(527)-N(7))-methyltransferase RsmG [Defluviimonas sp. SAOS-178_SWC]|uniref:16S rRNA (guanine(527)-N(7))-methyltransferase RsmG n=1 Tax=Defluviimonas sp. SAOS-178_SWC TaxID=3121287 RepID=UPI00322195EB